MNDAEKRSGATPNVPEPEVHRRRRWQFSLIWLVPLVVALVGLSMVVSSYVSAGPQITITFQSAEGLEAGKTEVKYKNVVIGKVKTIELSGDRSKVLVNVDLKKKDSSFATQGSRFWVVRPRIGLGGVSGLGTLLSGAYIGADTGQSQKAQHQFAGLETPPPLTHGEAGSSYLLRSSDLGSLDIGSPVYFRRIQVGRVVAYHLDSDGKGVSVQVFVKAPNDKFVTKETRFWNASGVDVNVNANGLKLNTESLATVVAGGVAFQRPPHAGKDRTRAEPGTRFKLYDGRSKAMTPPDGPPVMITMRFRQSVRGLSVGAPIDFQGITLGEVKAITLNFDPKTKYFPVDVTAVVYPERMGRANARFIKRAGDRYAHNHGALLGILVKHGLRAQLRNGNLLTGQLYVALDFLPHSKKVKFDPDAKPLHIPTTQGNFDRIQEQVGHIVDKLDKVPFDKIGNNLNGSLKGVDQLLKKVNTQIVPQLKTTLDEAHDTLGTVNQALGGDSPLRQNIGQTLNELQRAARSLRVLSDYLSRHPEALLRGRRNAPPPLAPDKDDEGRQ
ncbi:MlaD family protein [Oleiagrimonas sp. C23AA]|uniref:PqiB family protein n=1 Tax=Oleiagrimonas sp. C23AA TaxID=2719047 RepID=UPI001422B092|nr:MlaD family protein [Oleiagrimonas sp. C23AA]NII10081.1 MCE family protein [Oleiagrimonas sp. C23AA]